MSTLVKILVELVVGTRLVIFNCFEYYELLGIKLFGTCGNYIDKKRGGKKVEQLNIFLFYFVLHSALCQHYFEKTANKYW